MTPTRRLDWEDDDCFVAEAIAVAIDADRIAFDQLALTPVVVNLQI